MSMKVYNGYAIKNRSAYALLNFNLRLKFALEQKRNILVYEKAAKMVAEILQQLNDDPAFEEKLPTWFQYNLLDFIKNDSVKKYSIGKPTSIMYCVSLILNSCEKQIKDTMQRNPEFDFLFYITYFPMRTKILALIFCENPEFTKVFESFDGVSYYGYWDNSDKQDGVSYKDWNKRKKDWNNVLGGNGYGTPIACGLNAEPLGSKGSFSPAHEEIDMLIQHVMPFIPTYRHRLGQYVYAKARDIKTQEYLGDKKEISDFMAANRKTIDFLKTPVGKKYLSQIKKEYGKQVIKAITPEDLKRKILFGKK